MVLIAKRLQAVKPSPTLAVAAKAKELAELMTNVCPPSRELSVALTELETSVMWANAAIARNE